MTLTIAIPTYNRIEALQRNLSFLLPQISDQCRLLIIDNSSDTPVLPTIDRQLAARPGLRVQVIRNMANIGANANIMRCFELCDTEWLWVLSDDDRVRPDAIQTILEHIREYSDCVFIHFARTMYRRQQRRMTRGTLDFVRAEDTVIHFGLISSGVYKASFLRKNLRYGYHYAYSAVPHLVMLLMSLADSEQCCLSDEGVLDVEGLGTSPEQGWSWLSVVMGLGTLLDLPLDVAIRKQLSIRLMSPWVEPHRMVNQLLGQEDYRSAGYLYDQIYHRFYKNCLGPAGRAYAALLSLLVRYPEVGRFLVGHIHGRMHRRSTVRPVAIPRDNRL